MCILKPNRPNQTGTKSPAPLATPVVHMSTSKEGASKEEASREDKDTPNIKDTYLSMDGIPPAITIHERSDMSTIVQFTSGHRFDDKSTLATKNFAWDKRMNTNVRIWAKDTCLSSLLKTYAIEPQYIMPDHEAEFYEFKGHCLLKPRCFLVHDLYSDIHSVLTRSGFKWSREVRAWIKKMKPTDYRNDIMNSFKKAPQWLCHHGTDEANDAKQNIKQARHDQRDVASQLEYQDASFEHQHADFKRARQEQRNTTSQLEYRDAIFEHRRADFMYRLHRADSDIDYQRASYTYGQQIKHLAEQGIYDYPDPPKLPRYR